jgi:predicted dehydrogenase
MWGIRRTVFKIAGRTRPRLLTHVALMKSADPHIGVIGCGQFAFSTLGAAITKRFGNAFAACYDVSVSAQESFRSFYRIRSQASSADDVIQDPRVRIVYITSNHATHADYAIRVLNAKKIAYVEKPVAVTADQFKRLSESIRATGGTVYAGYNRPFAPAIRTVCGSLTRERGPMTISCFVVGHDIPSSHWYRNPEEGTRICGNVGHWLDLAVHLLTRTSLPDRWTIRLTYSDANIADDNLAISLASTRGDLVNIVLSSRSEPFDGIMETINIQHSDVIAKIDDFRVMEIWKGSSHARYRYWPKDAGHYGALLQHASPGRRDWKEVEQSTSLMLAIKDMVLAGETTRSFSFAEEFARVCS